MTVLHSPSLSNGGAIWYDAPSPPKFRGHRLLNVIPFATRACRSTPLLTYVKRSSTFVVEDTSLALDMCCTLRVTVVDPALGDLIG